MESQVSEDQKKNVPLDHKSNLYLYWWGQEIPDGGHQRPGSEKKLEPIPSDPKHSDLDPLLA